MYNPLQAKRSWGYKMTPTLSELRSSSICYHINHLNQMNHSSDNKGRMGESKKSTSNEYFLVVCLPVACCLLLAACYLLPAACCLLPVACCLLLATCCLLPAACCLLPVACCLLPYIAKLNQIYKYIY
jgi:hypothetical protein